VTLLTFKSRLVGFLPLKIERLQGGIAAIDHVRVNVDLVREGKRSMVPILEIRSSLIRKESVRKWSRIPVYPASCDGPQCGIRPRDPEEVHRKKEEERRRRAVGKMKVTITCRFAFDVEGRSRKIEVDNEADNRFSFLLEKRHGRWGVVFYTLLFDKDKTVPCESVLPSRMWVLRFWRMRLRSILSMYLMSSEPPLHSPFFPCFLLFLVALLLFASCDSVYPNLPLKQAIHAKHLLCLPFKPR
jgi:hypothetical protein